jgi:hypothetical protein
MVNVKGNGGGGDNGVYSVNQATDKLTGLNYLTYFPTILEREGPRASACR